MLTVTHGRKSTRNIYWFTRCFWRHHWYVLYRTCGPVFITTTIILNALSQRCFGDLAVDERQSEGDNFSRAELFKLSLVPLYTLARLQMWPCLGRTWARYELSTRTRIDTRRFSRNIGLGLVLAAFVALIFGLTVVKITEGDVARHCGAQPMNSSANSKTAMKAVGVVF